MLDVWLWGLFSYYIARIYLFFDFYNGAFYYQNV